MRIIIWGILVGFFVVLPLYLLNAVVLPEISQLQYTYSHADEIASKVVSQK